jgi:surface antigen
MRTRAIFACISSITCAAALAGNLTDDAPFAHFKGKDQALFESALHLVLDNGTSGFTQSWSNPDTKARGEVKAVKSYARADAPCRTVAIANRAGGRTSSANYNFCKSAGGKWVLTQ